MASADHVVSRTPWAVAQAAVGPGFGHTSGPGPDSGGPEIEPTYCTKNTCDRRRAGILLAPLLGRRPPCLRAVEGESILRSVVSLGVLVLLAAAVSPPGLAASGEVEFRIIVHPDVSGTHLPREDLSAIFRGDEDRWSDGQPVRPVDQSLRSPVRAAFTEEVLGEQIDGIEAFWARKIVQGVTPPMVKSSDEDVIDYVSETRGAIGYVSVETSLPPTVRILSVLY